MLIIATIFALLYTHFVADFWFQSDKMALNKSTSLLWLTLHCLAYFTVSLLCLCFIFYNFNLNNFKIVFEYCLYLSLSHWVIDLFTSKLSSYFWKREKRHEFFIVIGFDQLLHQVTILLLVSILKIL
jgi:membrane-bound metal-dependent hydrolase YbcI (DUF457 family)